MKKILLIDDTEFYQNTYRSKLLSEGYLVTTANNGIEGIKALAADKPDLVLLDLMMPVMDGYKVLQAMKADANLKDIPVIVFSAKGVPDEVEKAIKMGAADFLVKATTPPNKVVAKIQKLFGSTPPMEQH